MCGLGNSKNKGKVAVALLSALSCSGNGTLATSVPNKDSGIVGNVLTTSLGVGLGGGLGVAGTLLIQKLLCKNSSGKDNLENKDLVNKVALPEVDKETGVIKLNSVKNIRYLGWKMKDKNGNLINDKAFIRSGNTNNLTPEDLAALKKLGVKTVIDLRMNDEICGFLSAKRKTPMDKFCNDPDVTYYGLGIPVTTSSFKNFNEMYCEYCAALGYDTQANSWNKQIGSSPMYFGPNQIWAIFDVIANAPEDGKILFHCSHGKDRTGILSALLLSIAGIDVNIVAKNFVDCYNQNGNNVAKDFTGVVMTQFISDLANTWGGVESYLTKCCGISPETMKKVRQRLNPKM
ncbi:MAG: tyrosine-protein phosphatase [Clostridia bacterium]|nr:tyrosine-protein phosphatase [Clostridia bacterium]